MTYVQMIIGYLTLSIPAISFFYMAPNLLFTWYGPWIVALLSGLYIWFITYWQHKALINSLIYKPTGQYQDILEKLVQVCGISSQKVSFRYAYTAEQIAMAMSNIVIIDPILCSIGDQDSTSDSVKTIFNQHIEPTLTVIQKQRLSELKNNLSTQVQCFILKHELGHVVDNFSQKKLFLILVQGTVSIYFGILAARFLINYNVVLAIVFGIFIQWLIDVFLSYICNIFFKLCAERKADRFAVQHSTVSEIEAAAHFFKKHQEILDIHPDQVLNFFAKLPSEFRSGHPHGVTRAKYLLKLAEQKKLKDI